MIMKTYPELKWELRATQIARVVYNELRTTPEDEVEVILRKQFGILEQFAPQVVPLCKSSLTFVDQPREEALKVWVEKLGSLENGIKNLFLPPITEHSILSAFEGHFPDFRLQAPLSHDVMEKLLLEFNRRRELPKAGWGLNALIWECLPMIESALWLYSTDRVDQLRELLDKPNGKPLLSNSSDALARKSVSTQIAEISRELEEVQELLCRHLAWMKHDYNPNPRA